MQCRVNDVTVDDLPKFLAADPTDETHALTIPDPYDPMQTVTLPLGLNGVFSSLNVRNLSADDYDSGNFTRLHLTSDTLTWDPTTTIYEEQENAMMDYTGRVVSRNDSAARGQNTMVINELNSLANDAADITDSDNFHKVLQAHAHVASFESGSFTTRASAPIDHQTLASRWMISPEQASKTVKVTTQRGVRTCIHPSLSRRFPTNDRFLRYNRLPHTIFSDTLFAGTRSLGGNNCAQVFASTTGWTRAYPLRRKGEAHEALSLFFQREGVPPTMVLDGSNEQTKGDFRRKLREADCHLRQTEPYSPWMQAAEGSIRELKRGVSRKMIRTGSPKVLWDHCIELEALIRSNSVNGIYMTNGQVPETIMKGTTADISHISEFGWYDWVMFRDNNPTFPDDKMILGRYLGPATDVGPIMTSKILKSNGQIVYRLTARSLTPEETDDPVQIEARRQFTQALDERIGPGATESDFESDELTPTYPPYEEASRHDDDDLPPEEVTPETGDNYINTEISFPKGGSMVRGRVISRKRDADGNPMGRAHPNPILDTRVYNVEFDDGDVTELTTNLIAESMYSQCDPDGNQYLLLDQLVDHRSNDRAVALPDQVIHRKDGKAYRRKTTTGWQLCCQWMDGSTSWEAVRDLKESHPVQVAEYAKTHKIDHEPAFNWWVPYVLKKRDRIISLVKRRNTRYLKRTHKFGIEMPKTVQEALALDRRNGNTLWADAIAKELKNVKVAFKILPDGAPAPIGHQKIPCHMIFDVKMEDFRRKARLVAGGHKTEAPATTTYASVVSRETVRLALTIAALNDLEVKVGDVLNAYITAPITEKVWTVLGPEFGPDQGRSAVIVRALYGLKSAGAAFRAHLASCMRQMGYTSCKADPDLWLKAMTRPDDGTRYYAYILCYVDDILCIHHDAMSVLNKINEYLPLKPDSVGDPDIYLGAKLRQTRLENGVWAWALSPSKYVGQAVRNCTKHLNENYNGKYSLPKKAENPFRMGYEPELDTSAPLDPDASSYYQSLIGVLRWMVEIGRIDIATEVSLLSSHLAYPREGHLEEALHVMAYLRQKHNSRLIFDPSYPDIDMTNFKECDWREFYGEVAEAIPTDAPEPLGKDVDLRMMVDSDHAGDKETRRSRTGFLIFCNNAIIDWLSKKQPTIESSVFGAEFVAMKHGMEKLRGLRYKIRMMGVPLTGPSYIYGDNMSVIHNTQRPESVLKKKSNSICYHAVRESVAMGESITGHIRTEDNLADLLTKVTYGAKRKRLVQGILHDIFT